MAIRCLYCGSDYDVNLFEFDRAVICVCGKTITFKDEQMTEEALLARRSEDRKVRDMGTMADRIASLIVDNDYPIIDIETEKQKLRERISGLFLDKMDMYDLINKRDSSD